MPYTLAVDSLVEVSGFAYQNAQLITTVYHYRVITAGVLNDGQNELSALGSQVQAAGGLFQVQAACQASNMVYQIIRTQLIKPTRYAIVSTASTLVGARVGTPAPQNVCAVITKTTELATARKLKQGKGQVGSTHVGGLLSSDIVNGFIVSATRDTVLAALANAIGTSITIAGGAVLQPVLWHRKAAGTSTDAITGVVPQVTARVMRRRTVGLGI